MKSRILFLLFLLLFLAGITITSAGGGIKPQYKPNERAAYLSDALETFLRPGLQLEIRQVQFNPPNVKVTFRISDDQGLGLDRLGSDTPGAIDINFVLARIRPGDTQYTSYITEPWTGSMTGVTVNVPASESDGTFASLGDGVYQYTFSAQLPANFEADATHTVGMFAERDLTDFNLSNSIASTTFNVVPSGKPVTQIRDVVRTEACNQCHDPLTHHEDDGPRQTTQLCILCHQPQNQDPDTGNTLDFKVMVHKIHMGANLPSVSGKPLNVLGTSGSSASGTATGATQHPVPGGSTPAGTPYAVSMLDASSIIWPQDVRNCTTCHQQATQADNYKNNPARATCGSCHDDVNFATGKNHAGGAQVDDTKCSTCHPADTGLEFDLSVAGAHTIPTNSKKLAGLNIKISQVINTNPGAHPTVSFTVTDNAGNPIDASKLDRLSFQMSGPTTDYTFMLEADEMEDARTATPGPTGYTYTFESTIPSDASGTYAIGAEGYRTVTIPSSLAGQSFLVRESAFNPVFYFSVDGSKVVVRRTVVALDNCNQCHKQLALHGGVRRNTEYCVLCHNPVHMDDENRPADQMPPNSLNSRILFHRIHRGENLENDWTIYGFGGSVINYNGLRFPGDLRDCAKCHVNNSYQVPLPAGLADTDTPRLFYSPLKPVASACLGCHDGVDAAAHAYLQTAPFGESCPVCHEEGARYAVSKMHSR